MDVNTITKEDPRYPKLLAQIGDAPKQLQYRGNWDPRLFEKCLAVVGTRKMTRYGKQVCEQIVSEVASAGVTIVSGFMYGIDATAHQAALNARGKTIAVMPCGIDLIHPEHQHELHGDITEAGGLILSEYEGTYPSSTWMFPRRNRIVAGLSQATLVVEAGEGSGALITANFAKKYGRKIFAVPNPITSAVSHGVTQLLREGAGLVSSAQDILHYYGLRPRIPKPGLGSPKPGLGDIEGKLEKKIVEHLAQDPMAMDDLSRALAMPASQLGAAVSLLQLEGYITEEEGKFYVS
ncbi:MAG: DNA-processing protein DprA [Candidatus Yanofskybacteria bacterium]|nr:DNA-processing protein DprA [Candidatus Yanofskybacteria bacterium]